MALDEHTISDFIKSARASVHGQADRDADFILGSEYDALAGSCAILWSRQAQRDTDLFRATRFNTAEDRDLTRLCYKRWGIQRYLDTRGTGVVVLTRAAGGAAETVWRGTRIQLYGDSLTAKGYRVTLDTPVAAGVTVITVAVESTEFGPASFMQTYSNLGLADALVDPTWVVSYLDCGRGTLFERAATLIARVRKTRLDQRVGYPQAIIDACKAAGAGQVAVFASDFGGDALDVGLNVTYVGDSGYSGNASLVQACTIAVRKARVCGDHMQVLPMARVPLTVTADIVLSAAPSQFDISRFEAIHYAALRQALNGEDGDFGYTRIGLMSAIARSTVEVQDVVFSAPLADAGVLVAGNFPPVLSRYVAGNIFLRYVAP